MQVKKEDVAVRDYEGREIEAQVLPMSDVQLSMSNFHVASYLGVTARDTPKYWLVFTASVPPLGFNTYVVSGAKGMRIFFMFILYKCITILSWYIDCPVCCGLLNAGAKLKRSSVYTYQGNKKFAFDIGSESLKITLSEENGKLNYHYKHRNLVC